MKRFFLIPVLFILFIALTSHQAHALPFSYTSEEINGTVVDADTSEPIEGVVVVAQWILYVAGFGEGGHWKVFKVHEAVTDKDGKYTIPGWGPKRRPFFTHLDTYDPQLSFFKRGYNYLRLFNSDKEQLYKIYGKDTVEGADFDKLRKILEIHTLEHNRSVRESIWGGKVIKLKRFGGEPVVEEVTDIYDMEGKVVRQLRTVVDDNVRLDRMLGLIYTDIFSNEERGLKLKDVKFMVREYSEAKKDLKPQPPVISPVLEPRLEKFLEEEFE